MGWSSSCVLRLENRCWRYKIASVAVRTMEMPDVLHPPRRGAGGHDPARWMTLPPTTVHTALPLSVVPAYGVFRPFERKVVGSTTHSWSGSKTVTSDTAPLASVPPGRLKSRAGAQLMRSMSVE